jgi:hypothetical protein
MTRPAAAGLFGPPSPGTFDERTALESGVGFTDIVEHPTRGENDSRPEALRHEREVLVREPRTAARRSSPLRPQAPVSALLGTAGPPGFQPTRATWARASSACLAPPPAAMTPPSPWRVFSEPWTDAAQGRSERLALPQVPQARVSTSRLYSHLTPEKADYDARPDRSGGAPS